MDSNFDWAMLFLKSISASSVAGPTAGSIDFDLAAEVFELFDVFKGNVVDCD